MPAGPAIDGARQKIVSKGRYRSVARADHAITILGAILTLMALATAAQGEPMVTLAHNRPAAALQNPVVGTAAVSRQLKLSVSLKPQAAGALAHLLADLQNPASPRYHRWLSGAEFDARFGPTPAQMASVAQWLSAQGFAVATPLHGGQIRFSGSVGTVERAFQTTIATYADGSVYANLDEPRIPYRLASTIGAIGGMDNMLRVVPAVRAPGIAPAVLAMPVLSMLGRSLGPSTQLGEGATPLTIVSPWRAAFAPSDFYTFYDEPAATRALSGPECIAIVGDSDYLPAALALFDSQFDLPNVAPSQKLVDGNSPGIGSGELEALLDLEWSHASAPQAPQIFYLANPATGSLVDAIAAAIQENLCRVISISFDYCGQPDNFYSGTLDPLFAQAAAQGQSVFVSSGDWGAANLVFDPTQSTCVAASSRNVSEMAADPNVTAVGGSEFQPTYDGTGNDVGFVSERVYNDSDQPVAAGAGGGGSSAIFPKPSYQSGPGVPADNARDLPDVALMASPYQPGAYFGSDNGGSAALGCCAGGTSLATPLWSGVGWLLSYRAGTRLGNLNPGLYRQAAAGSAAAGFRDITTGDNSFNGVVGYQAGAGYDLASGWGTIDISDLLSAWVAVSTPTPSASATATPSATPTATVSASASASPKATPLPTPSGSATATFSPTPSLTPSATPTLSPTMSASPSRTAIASPTPTARSSSTPGPSPSPEPTQTSAPSASPTASFNPPPTSSPMPTPAPTSSVVPVPGGNVSGAAAVNLSVVPGQTVTIGTFTLDASPGTSQQIASLTITLSDPSMFQWLILNATTPGATRSVTLDAPGTTSVFAFNPPFALAGGASAQFVLQGLVAGP